MSGRQGGVCFIYVPGMAALRCMCRVAGEPAPTSHLPLFRRQEQFNDFHLSRLDMFAPFDTSGGFAFVLPAFSPSAAFHAIPALDCCVNRTHLRLPCSCRSAFSWTRRFSFENYVSQQKVERCTLQGFAKISREKAGCPALDREEIAHLDRCNRCSRAPRG